MSAESTQQPDDGGSPAPSKPLVSVIFDDVVSWLDRRLGGFFSAAGVMVHFAYATLIGVGRGLLSTCGIGRCKAFAWREAVKQMEQAGTQSMAIITLVAFLVGVTLVLQTIFVLDAWGQRDLVSAVVAVAFVRELGPLIVAIIFTGRVGAAYTAEIGTMKVQEEVLALQTMGINPIIYLVAPRFIASTLMLPCLSIVSIFVGIFGGYLIGVYLYGIDNTIYIENARLYLDHIDVYFGILKSVFFGALIVTIACYKGFTVEGGGEDVGRATMHCVVLTLVAIIFSDTIWTLVYNIYRGF